MNGVSNVLILSACILLSGTGKAYAYLDPGTGNALIYLAVSLIGAVVYAAKSVFYRLSRRKKTSVRHRENGQNAPVVIFSDGEMFSPVIDALIEKGRPFVYYSTDGNDPALNVKHPLMTARHIEKNALKQTGFVSDLIDAANDAAFKKSRSLVIFSEGKNYWGTFKPVIEALLSKKQPFTYLSMDIRDPALTIENDLMTSRYIGNGTLAFSKMNRLDADILLSTTPNIGTDNYPIIKSKNVRSLVHIWHSFGDYTYAWYHHGSLDAYDEILTAGDYMDPQIRLIEKKRGLKEKKLVPVGVPYLDDLAKERAPVETDGKTVLIAPSWGTKGCLTVYGIGFVRDLAQAGFNVIIRPHPQSLKVEKDKFDGFKRALNTFSNVVWDERVNGNASMAKADVMISDTSSVRMDFFVLYKRPVITLEMPVADTESYEYEDLKDLLAKSTMETDIGDKVAKEDIGDIVERVKTALSSTRSRDFDAITAKYVANFGHSGEAIADYLISELNK